MVVVVVMPPPYAPAVAVVPPVQDETTTNSITNTNPTLLPLTFLAPLPRLLRRPNSFNHVHLVVQ